MKIQSCVSKKVVDKRGKTLYGRETSLTSVFGQHSKSIIRIDNFIANRKQTVGRSTVDHDKERPEWLLVSAIGDFDD
jgi:hypothetical protein